jgi:hypothetical protein
MPILNGRHIEESPEKIRGRYHLRYHQPKPAEGAKESYSK